MLLKNNSIIKTFQSLGYDFSTDPRHINLFGIRTNDKKVNFYDDLIGIFYFNKKKEITTLIFKSTTKPGLPWLLKPIMRKGTAILVPGQYKNVYKIGLHKRKTLAFIQRGNKLKVYRDRNKDKKFDYDPKSIEEGYFGINLHPAKGLSKFVGLNSAGCQVVKSKYDMDLMLHFGKLSNQKWFDYTLILENQIVI